MTKLSLNLIRMRMRFYVHNINIYNFFRKKLNEISFSRKTIKI